MADAQSSTPPFFNFLKEGLLLPTHNRRLFAAVFTIIVASSSLLLLGNDLAVKPLADEIRIDANKALNITDPASSPEFRHLIQEIQDDTRKLFIAIAVYFLVAIFIGSLIRVVVLFAAVATYSGELHTFASLLGKAKAQLKGPLLTLAFVYVLEIACTALLMAMVGLQIFFRFKQYFALIFVGALLAIVASLFFVYFSFVCSLSMVVAVAEPGCYGAGAVGRAWRLMKGKGKLLRAVVFILVTLVLAAAFWPVHSLAKTCAVTSMASGLLLGFLYTILMAAVGLFGTCALTAFYYECKGSTEASAMEYIKVSTKESINV